MYIVPLKSAVVEAIRQTFNSAYPEPDFQNIHASIEFPNLPQHYPGIWVTYEDTSSLVRAGINHKEIVADQLGTHEVTRWRFAGSLSFTIGALTSLERDRLYDEMVRVLAFANVDRTQASAFHRSIEGNDLFGINVQADILTASGDAANPGTPWDTDEMIYERTLSTDVIGEFVSNPSTNSLALLSNVLVEGYLEGSRPPTFPDLVDNTSGAYRPYSPTDWI